MKPIQTGLFFGSFNPVHAGHQMIASYMANFTSLDEVWLVVSPQNPLKSKNGMEHVYDRLEMARLAFQHADRIRVSSIELELPRPSYTIHTLAYLEEKYPGRVWHLIMGADNLASLKKWKNYEVILKNYPIFVYPRPGAEVSEWENHPSITFTETPLMEISSTFIRSAIKAGKNVQYFVAEEVLDFIERKNMYR